MKISKFFKIFTASLLIGGAVPATIAISKSNDVISAKAEDKTVVPLYSLGIYYHTWDGSKTQLVCTYHGSADTPIYSTFDASELLTAVQDKVKINGEYISAINTASSGSVSVLNISQTHKLVLNIKDSVLKWDGSDTFVFESGIEYPIARTSIAYGYTMYEATISGTGWQGGCKFRTMGAIPNGETTTITSADLYHNSYNNGYDTLVFVSDKPVFNATSDGETAAHVKEVLNNCVYINGKPVSEYSSGFSFRLDINSNRQRLAIQVSQSQNIFKGDGKDTIVFTKGTVFSSGVTISDTTTAVIYKYVAGAGDIRTSQVAVYHGNSTNTLTGSVFYNFNASASNHDVFLAFGKKINGSYSKDYADKILKYNMIINGTHLGDIANVLIRGWNQGGNQEKLWITIPGSAFKLDNTDVVEFKAPIVTLAEEVLDKDYTFNILGSTWYFAEDKAAVDTFVETLHMSDYTENLGYCSDEEHAYYATAKAAFNALNATCKKMFVNESLYASAKERLVAWAAVNGDAVSANGITSQSSNLLVASIANNNAVVILTSFALVSLIAVACFIALKKRKEN